MAWTGDLARILKSFSTDASDFLSFDAARPEASDAHYTQQRLRNYLADAEVLKALVVPARYSRRMLAAVHELVASGKHAFCETRSPSLCAQAGWCTHRGMRELKPEVFSAYDCCNQIPLADVWRRQKLWHRASKETRPPGQLLHRVQV